MITQDVKYLRKTDNKHSDGTYLHAYLCFCGVEFLAIPRYITSKKTVSCGCYRKSGGSKPRLGLTPKNAFLDPTLSSFNGLLIRYKNSAKHRSLAFALDIDMFRKLTKGDCHYCGTPPGNRNKQTKWAREPYVFNGIDRKDSAVGYIADNCVSCCMRCNYLKSDMPYDEFLLLVKTIHDRLFK